MVSGIDARLIEAEAKLNAERHRRDDDDPQRAARGAAEDQQLSAGGDGARSPTPATQDAATTLFFREKAFWTFGRGQRLNDMRRLMRQYGRTEDQVFPTGSYFKGGTYGHTIQLPGAEHGAARTRCSRAASTAIRKRGRVSCIEQPAAACRGLSSYQRRAALCVATSCTV